MAVYELTTPPLSSEEKAWCKALEKLLMATPARLGLYTVGDRDLHCFDTEAVSQRGIEIADGGSSQAGLDLATIKCRVLIHTICS